VSEQDYSVAEHYQQQLEEARAELERERKWRSSARWALQCYRDYGSIHGGRLERLLAEEGLKSTVQKRRSDEH
jgi:hypothetical protein